MRLSMLNCKQNLEGIFVQQSIFYNKDEATFRKMIDFRGSVNIIRYSSVTVFASC